VEHLLQTDFAKHLFTYIFKSNSQRVSATHIKANYKMRFDRILIIALLLSGFNNALFAITIKGNRFPAADSTFKTANAFQSNMVVQQQKPFAIWGNSVAGSIVTIKADWTNKTITITADKNNYWKGAIPVPKAIPGDFKPHTLTLTSNNQTITLTNLLIGDVWLASGQSNMQFSVEGEEKYDNGVLNYKEEIAAATYPDIRWLYVDLNFKAQPFNEVTGKWAVCSPATVGHFSGVAYYFARHLFQHLNIPIGIILSNIGASTGQAWTSRAELESDTALYNKYLKPYDESPKSKEVINPGFTFEKVTRPTLLYNAMIHPFAGLSIKGFIWYQGEFNHVDKGKYTLLEQHMIRGWRSDFGQGDLPFYFVQMPSYFWDNPDPKAFDYAIFREAQSNIKKIVPNTEMAVTLDDSVPRLLHPRNKKPVGERLAQIALNKTYNIKTTPYLGPQFAKMKTKGDEVTVYYNSKTLYGGLMTKDGQALRNFFVAGNDKVFHAAIAKIDGTHIILKSDSVANPVAVRFAFTNTAVINLFNKAGLPAEPFRTDDWAAVDAPPQIKLDYKKLNEGK
jgi:sialate O-acetylesterase